MKKILGILGGMGPYATIDFIRHIYDLTPNVNGDSDHIHIITDINVKIPSRTRAILYQEESPVGGMISSINNLADQGVDLVAVPCNSAHYFYKDVNKHLKIEWINMIQIVCDLLDSSDYSNPLILGGFVTVNKRTYSDYRSDCVYLDDEANEIVYQLINNIKLDKKKYDDEVEDLIQSIINLDCGIVVLACTELTVIAQILKDRGLKVIDSNLEYAKYLVKKLI